MWTVHNNQLITLTCGQCGQLVWILSTMSTTESILEKVWGRVCKVWTMWTLWTIILNCWLTTLALETIYKIQSSAIYLFLIVHNIHKQTSYGSDCLLPLSTILSTTSPQLPKLVHNMTRTPDTTTNVKELLAVS